MRPEARTLDTPSGSKPALDLEKLPPDAWRPSETPGQRRIPRTTEREIEMIPAWIRSAKDPDWVQVRLWDYSTTGFGILYHANSGHALFSKVGAAIELKLDGFPGIAPAEEMDILVPCRIENCARLEKGMRLGLSRSDIRSHGGKPADGFPEGYLYDGARPLAAKVRNPFLYNEWAAAELIGIGPSPVFVFESSDPCLLLFKDTRIVMDLEIPLETKGTFTGILSWARQGERGSMLFAIDGGGISFQLSNAIGEHFVRAEVCKPSRLAEYGIRMKNFKDQFRFRFVSTQEEYHGILQLRRKAYVDAGKMKADAPPDPVGADFDSRSRLLTAFHGDVLVASIALTFGSETIPFRSATCFPDCEYPVAIPPRNKVIECRSLCTDFEYRGGDLIQGMFEHIARCVLFSDRQWLLTLATAKLWPLYRRIGFRKTGASTSVAELGGVEHFLILMHRDSLISGTKMTPFAWNYFFGQMVRDLLAKGQLRLGFRQRAKVAVYSCFAGMTRKWMQAQFERQFRILLHKRSRKEMENDR